MEKTEEGQNDWVTINLNALNSISREMDDEFVKNKFLNIIEISN